MTVLEEFLELGDKIWQFFEYDDETSKNGAFSTNYDLQSHTPLPFSLWNSQITDTWDLW